MEDDAIVLEMKLEQEEYSLTYAGALNKKHQSQ
jgi:hypothetical protein